VSFVFYSLHSCSAVFAFTDYCRLITDYFFQKKTVKSFFNQWNPWILWTFDIDWKWSKYG